MTDSHTANAPNSATGRLLKRSTVIFYSLPQLPLSMAILPMAMFLPQLYTGNLGLDLAVYANVLLAVSLFDTLTDPLIGYLSDKTRSRYGRRRPWVLAGVPMMMLGIYHLFMPTGSVDGWHLFTWMMVLRLGWTMVLIPYYAWGAELSQDYSERSVITGWRAFVGIAGGLSMQLILVVALIGFDFGGSQNALWLVGVVVLLVTPIAAGLALYFVPETTQVVPSTVSVLQGLRIMWRNGPFKRLIFAFLVGNTSYAINLQLFVFYISAVIGDSRAFVWLLLITNVTAMSSIALWVKLSERIGKHRAWIAGYLLVAAVSPFYLFLGQGDILWVIPIVILGGIGSATFEALPNSMKADVIDLDTLRSGEDRAAWFFAVWSFTGKLSMTIAGWLALRALDFAGFDPALGVNNGADELFALKALYGLGPPVFLICACIIAWRYPITKARHQRLRETLARKRARQEAAKGN
ncbi:MAG: MFS transporter [Pseudomonadales bacterium]